MRALGARLQAGNLAVAAGVLAELFDHAPDLAFFVKDSEGRYVAVNASLIKRHGYRHKSQVLGRRPSDICPSDFGRLPAEQDAQVFAYRKTAHQPSGTAMVPAPPTGVVPDHQIAAPGRGRKGHRAGRHLARATG
jgi:PAS domain-containing protein